MRLLRCPTNRAQHAVASNLACLMAYTGRVETDPNREDFNRNWRSFEKASLVFGVFPAAVPTPYFYDRTTGLLQVAAELSDAEKVEAMEKPPPGVDLVVGKPFRLAGLREAIEKVLLRV